MFTGIIEALGEVAELRKEKENLHLTIKSALAPELQIDQSIAHNGICLTVVSLDEASYTVTAIQETISKTNIGHIKKGDQINLERCLMVNSRLDGHMVQGHVDTTLEVIDVTEASGSWYFTFELPAEKRNLIVEKGSVCINGVSLTVVAPTDNTFSVAIIPYTYEHTNFQHIKKGDRVNVEFDIIGKYLFNFFNVYKDQNG